MELYGHTRSPGRALAEPWRALAASWVGLEGLVGGHTSQPPPEAPPGGKNLTVEAHPRGTPKRAEETP